MPNANFQPLIGEGFGDLARQSQFYAGFNARMDEANISRANAAEQTRNSYLQTVAQMQQAENLRQAALQQRESEGTRADRWQYAQEAERRKELADQAAEQKRQFGESLKFQNEQLKASEKAQQGKLSLLEQQQQMKIDHAGEIHAMQYAELVHDRDASQKALDVLEEEDKNSQARIAELSSKKKLSTMESAESTRLALHHNEVAKQIKAAQRAADHSARALDGRVAVMSAQGFSVDETGGRILHEPTGKVFNFKQAVKDARNASSGSASPAATEADTGAGADAGDVGADENSPPAWVSAGPGALSPGDFSVTPPSGQSPVSPMKIGRFSVTPR